MPISGQYQSQLADASDNALSMPSLEDEAYIADIGEVGAPGFSLEDSDSDDSVHQFMCGLQRLRSPGQGRGSESQDGEDADDDEEGILMGSAGIGSPFGVRTRPPSPRRPITARPFTCRATASGPAALSMASPMQKSCTVASPSPHRHGGKKRAEEGGDVLGSGGLPWGQENRQRPLAETVAKRRRVASPSPSVASPQPLGDASNRRLGRCMSEMQCDSAFAVAMDTARIDNAIASIDSLNLIGNSEQGHALPTVKELDFGIRYVTPATVSRLLAGQFADRVSDFAIVDCRYPYEFRGGHIRGAVNVYRPEELLDLMLTPDSGLPGSAGRVIIFHCEFSSERAPRMARLLRQRDREINSHNYPQLHYPELYLLQGGYKAFFEAQKADCEPASYTKMADPEHKEELTHFHRLGKAWERQNSRSKHSRLQRMAGSPLLL